MLHTGLYKVEHGGGLTGLFVRGFTVLRNLEQGLAEICVEGTCFAVVGLSFRCWNSNIRT